MYDVDLSVCVTLAPPSDSPPSLFISFLPRSTFFAHNPTRLSIRRTRRVKVQINTIFPHTHKHPPYNLQSSHPTRASCDHQQQKTDNTSTHDGPSPLHPVTRRPHLCCRTTTTTTTVAFCVSHRSHMGYENISYRCA